MLNSLLRTALGKGFLFAAAAAIVLAGSASRASAQDIRNPDGGNLDPGFAVPEISTSNTAAMAILLLGSVALIAESKAKPSCKS